MPRPHMTKYPAFPRGTTQVGTLITSWGGDDSLKSWPLLRDAYASTPSSAHRTYRLEHEVYSAAPPMLNLFDLAVTKLKVDRLISFQKAI